MWRLSKSGTTRGFWDANFIPNSSRVPSSLTPYSKPSLAPPINIAEKGWARFRALYWRKRLRWPPPKKFERFVLPEGVCVITPVCVSFRGAAGDEESRIALKTLRARFLAPLGMTAWPSFHTDSNGEGCIFDGPRVQLQIWEAIVP